MFRLLWLYHSIFLSTPSARRATSRAPLFDGREDISIHALREEGDLPFWKDTEHTQLISIHALREEGDYFRHVR